MRKITDKIVCLLTDKKRRVPLVMINFNYQKYSQNGAEGSCVCSVHPDLAQDETLKNLLNQVVDHIRNSHDMKNLTDI